MITHLVSSELFLQKTRISNQGRNSVQPESIKKFVYFLFFDILTNNGICKHIYIDYLHY
jgi:hypothetical protein